MARLRSFPWYGGKFSQLKWILPLIDSVDHVSYVEPYGGSASILLNKSPSLVEVYNDVYSDVVRFFRTLRRNPEELISLLELTPYSREEYVLACNPDYDNDSEIELARKFFYKAKATMFGLATTATPGRWAFSKKESRRGMSIVVSRWLSGIQGLKEVAERLRTVLFENRDALWVLKKYDHDEALHYLDPPYMLEERTGGRGYQDEYSKKDHEKMLETIVQLKGKVIVSGYSNYLYDSALSDWDKVEKEVNSASTRKYKGAEQKRTEVVWKNF